MIYKRIVLLAGLMTCLAGISSRAQSAAVPETSTVSQKPGSAEEAGKLGDPAPPLTVMEWVKGKPVKIRPGTNTYVLIFCTLSRAGEYAITNLNALQKKYQDKGVIVAAISGEAPEDLKNFILARGGGIEFTVAADDLARKTTSEYQRKFNQLMLPRAFIVDKEGKVLWFGHPLRDDMGLVVDEITSGRYNLDQTQKKIIASEQMEQYLALARQDDPRTPEIGRIMLMLRTNDAPALCDLALQIATAPYIEQRDVALASAALDRAEQLSATNKPAIAANRAILQVEQYLALARKNDAASTQMGRNLLSSRTNDATGLCDLAFKIATDRAIENDKRDVQLATAALDRAAQLSTTNATDIAVDRAILLFQTGKEAAGLVQAKEALASAQSEEDKSQANACIRAMETRLQMMKDSQTNSSSTNSPAGKP